MTVDPMPAVALGEVGTPQPQPLRSRLLGIFSLPMLMLVSTLFTIPLVALGWLNIGSAVLVTVLAEMLVLLLALVSTDTLRPWRSRLRLHHFRWKTVGLGALLGLGMLVLLQATVISLGALGVAIGSSNTSSSMGELSGAWRFLILSLVVPFLVPLIEEVFFRGYTMGFVMDSFKDRRRGVAVGLLVTSVAFGLAHAQGFSTPSDFFVMGWTATMGLVNGILLWKSDSVYPCYALHLSYNLLTSAMIAFL